MNKKIIFGLALLSLFVLTGCEKKCEEGYTKEDNSCVKYTLKEEALVPNYKCDDEWHLEGTECVNGEMPTINDGCPENENEGITDRVGSDGFCHHYKAATVEYSCSDNTTLKDGKCYEVSKKDLK